MVGFATGTLLVGAANAFGEVGVGLGSPDGSAVFAVRALVGQFVGNRVMVREGVSNVVDCWRNSDDMV